MQTFSRPLFSIFSGMTKDDMVKNLGTIARSGSKIFVEELSKMEKGDSGKSVAPESIIGQFGVGFYSAFMVADKIDVYSLSSQPDSVALHWQSDGHGSYTIEEVDDMPMTPGTKVVVHLKSSCAGWLLIYFFRPVTLEQ